MQRYHITVGAKTTANGTVRSGCAGCTIDGMAQSIEGDEVYCLVEVINGRNAALDDDICSCKCDPPPRLIANQSRSSQIIKVSASSYISEGRGAR